MAPLNEEVDSAPAPVADTKSAVADAKGDAAPESSNETTSNALTKDEAKAQASVLMSEGKRFVLEKNWNDAVDRFGRANTLLEATFGPKCDESGECLYWYGRTLVDLARFEDSIFGNALKGVPEEDDKADDKNDSKVEDPDKLDEEEQNKIADEVEKAIEERTNELESKVAEETLEKAEDEKTGSASTEVSSKTENATEKAEDEKTPGSASAEVASKTEDAVDKSQEKEAEAQPVATESKDSSESQEKPVETVETENSVDLTVTKPTGASDLTQPDEKCQQKGEQPDKKEITEDDREAQDDGKKADDDEAAKGGEGEKTEATEGDKEGEGEDQQEDNTEETENEADNVENLQLAWESLEVARSIIERQVEKNPEMKELLADTHRWLGDVALENDQVDQAIEEFTACMSLHKEFKDKSNRAIAEVLYELGLAFDLKKDYTHSVKYYQDAVQTLELCIKDLQAYIAAPGEGVSESVIQAKEAELKELTSLLPDLVAKVSDAESSMNAAPVQQEEKSGETSSKPVEDISHLVRKKRKPSNEGGNSGEGEPPKKVHMEGTNGTNGVNGAANGENGSVNGHEESKEAPKEAPEIKVKTVEDVEAAKKEAENVA